MRRSLLDVLGGAAAAARRAGLRRAVHAAASAVDAACMLAGVAPLRADAGGTIVRGYLRHRSFLAEAATPAATYRELFLRLLQPGMTVVDAGAHVGLYTMLAARAVGETGRVLAFEPDRYNLAALRHNVARATNVTVIPKALADRPGTVSFYETRGTIGSSIVARDNARRREVETTSVDVELAGRTFAALLVKLNIEGAELLALEGMHETLARGSGGVAILVEINPPLLAAAGSSGDAVVEWLTAERFTVERVDLPTQEPRPLERPLAKGHLLARRPHADDVVPHLEHGIRRELDDERT